MGIIYVLIGALCFAISNAYWKKVTATIPYQIGMFYRGIFATIIFSVLYFGFRQADFFKYWWRMYTVPGRPIQGGFWKRCLHRLQREHVLDRYRR